MRMKNTHSLKLAKLALALGILSFLSFPALAVKIEGKPIEMYTKKIGEVTHWLPEEVTVTQGERVTFIVKHEMGGKYNFHGFAIPDLHIAETVKEHETKTIPVTINLKPGTYEIRCQFHFPAHVSSKLIVLPAADGVKSDKKSATSPTTN